MASVVSLWNSRTMANRICILGSTGFVGGVLASELQSRYQVFTPTRKDLDLTSYHDLSYFLTNMPPFDVIINCAGSVDTKLTSFNYSVFHNNMSMILNLHRCKDMFGRLINFGSGAEFDRRQAIIEADYFDIDFVRPVDHYGLSKHLAAKLVVGNSHWYHLRLFGVFGPTESEHRLLRRIQRGEPVNIVNRLFSYFYVNDIVPVVEYYINEPIPVCNDINLVYPENVMLWDFVEKFCEIHGITNPAQLENGVGLSYTGASEELSKLNLPLVGLEEG